MVGVTPNRKARRAAAATAPIEPAIAASAERAAIERDPAASGDEIDAALTGTDPTAPVEGPTDAKVVTEPTLIATPDAPQPIVTAAPILAMEPTATDIVQAEAAADRVEAGIGTDTNCESVRPAVAGQTTLTIEEDAVAMRDVAVTRRDGPATGRDPEPAGEAWSLVDDLVEELEMLKRLNPAALDGLLRRFLPAEDMGERSFVADAARPFSSATVPVVEVVGPPQGRRRGGMTFGPTPRLFRAGALSEDLIEALRADPLLAVNLRLVDETEAPAAIVADG